MSFEVQERARAHKEGRKWGGVKEGEKGKGENEEGGRRCLYF